MIGVDAGMNVSAASISTAGSLFANILNFNSGAIGGNATINVTAANITTGAALTAAIDNSSAGTIGGSADILHSHWRSHRFGRRELFDR